MREILFLTLLLALAAPARAERPPCTGDRHDDCYASCTVDGDTCRAECPEPAPCQPVTCSCVEEHTTVQVDRCPSYRYIDHIDRCRKTKTGAVKCPIKDHPRRLFVPRYED